MNPEDFEAALPEPALREIAVDLVTAVVQQVFADLDGRSLVEAAADDLVESDKEHLVNLIDQAVVDLVVDFES